MAGFLFFESCARATSSGPPLPHAGSFGAKRRGGVSATRPVWEHVKSTRSPSTRASAFSPRIAPELVQDSPPSSKQGCREGRALAAPVARLQKKMQAAGTTGLAEHARPSPRDGLADYTHSPRGPAVLPPSPASSSRRRLDLSSGRPGPCDFTVASDRSSARAGPRCDPTRPPHPAPDVRDDREAPLV
jgi:hypothetical protein